MKKSSATRSVKAVKKAKKQITKPKPLEDRFLEERALEPGERCTRAKNHQAGEHHHAKWSGRSNEGRCDFVAGETDAAVEAVAKVICIRFFCRLQSNRIISENDKKVAAECIRAYHEGMLAKAAAPKG